MGIPVAISPTVRSPGTAIVVNLKAGTPSPGTGTRRVLILAVASATAGGTITADTQLVQGVAGEAEAGTLVGVGTPGHLVAKRVFRANPLAQVDICAAAEPGGTAATGTLTFALSPTADRLPRVRIAGRTINSTWLAGETAIQGATRLVGLINQQSDNLPVVASNVGGTAAVVTLTAKAKGTWGNDIAISCELIGGATGTLTASGAALTGATTEPDWANVLDLVSGREYRTILAAASNADVEAGSSGVPGAIETHIATYDHGFGAKLQQATLGCTSSSNATLKVATNAVNFERIQFVLARDGLSLPCEWAAAEGAQRNAVETPARPNVNRVNSEYPTGDLYAPLDLVASTPTPPEAEDDVQNGITTVTYDDGGNPRVLRPVTSYFHTTDGSPDDRVLDVTRVTSCDEVARDIGVYITEEFRGLNIIADEDLLDGDEMPEGCISIGEIRAGVIGRMDGWLRNGTVLRSKLQQAIDDGTFIVRQNPTDPGQVDYVVPVNIVSHIVKQSLVVEKH